VALREDTDVNPRIAGASPGRLPTLILRLALVYAAGLLLYGVWAQRTVYSVLLLSVVLLLVWVMRLGPVHRSRAAFVLCSAAAAVYLCETALALAMPFRAGAAASVDGRAYDSRTYHRVVRELRASGDDAYPCLFPRALLAAPAPALSVLPLGSVAGVTSVYCNESGEYLIYRSDEHGFHNPPGMWDSPLDVAIVGDSFAQGACVESSKNFAALIRRRHPRTLNLGMGGNGPLLSLASMQEYLPDLRPRTILWFFYEGNDLDDLGDEFEHPVLRRYLQEPDFRQGLRGSQPEIDVALRQYGDSSLDLSSAAAPALDSLVHRLDLRTTLLRAARLSHLRGIANQVFDDPLGYSVRDEADQIARLGAVLERARSTAETWGGTVYFVVLPSWDLAVRESGRRKRSVESSLEAARKAGVPALDLTDALRSAPDRNETFYYPGSHYSETGHRIVAETVLDQLAPALSAGSHEADTLQSDVDQPQQVR